MNTRKLQTLFMLSLVLLGLSTCKQGGGTTGGGSCMNIAGSWIMNESVDRSACGTGTSQKQSGFLVTQDSCSVVLQDIDNSRTLTGIVDNTSVSWTGSYPDNFGQKTDTASNIPLSGDGNGLSGAVTWNWSSGFTCSGTTQVTGTRLAVVSTSPENNAQDVWIYSDITATFTTVMNIDATTFMVSAGGNTISGTVSSGSYGTTAIFTPTQQLAPDTVYTATISGSIQPANGLTITLGKDVTWSFKVGPQPTSNIWFPTSTVNAPEARAGHCAVWTGTEMIVWGGWTDRSVMGSTFLNTGGKYNPTNDLWTSITTTNAPLPWYYECFWTGSDLITWATQTSLPFGRKYNPATDTWSAMSTTNAPFPNGGDTTKLNNITAVWSGTELIVWDGHSAVGGAGGRYNPVNDTWSSISKLNAPTANYGFSSVWTGSEMLMWGGSLFPDPVVNIGWRYNPASDVWTAITAVGDPQARKNHQAFWTGSEMIVWGGFDSNLVFQDSGGGYNPVTGSWTAISPSGFSFLSTGQFIDFWTRIPSVWTGSEMLVWLGDFVQMGAKYNPATDLWVPMRMDRSPTRRHSSSAVWTGSEMIIWGGEWPNSATAPRYTSTNTGGRYLP